MIVRAVFEFFEVLPEHPRNESRTPVGLDGARAVEITENEWGQGAEL
jgi:hypothetical protein